MKKTAFPAKGCVPLWREDAKGRQRRLRRAVGVRVANAQIGPTPVTIAVWDRRGRQGTPIEFR
jgi:hypothetical protein